MNNEENWFALRINVVAEAAEAVEFALNELGARGTEINNLGVKKAVILDVIGYFNELPAEEIIHAELAEALRIYEFNSDAILNTDWRKIGNVDWLFEWKKHWKPTETENFIIAPTWENVENPDKIVVSIEPNMAFGTGTHETTKLCLKAIAENYERGMSFLDVGTGTGILAIAAKLFAARMTNADSSNEKADSVDFLACDTDANSIKIAVENAELNGARGIDFYVGSISDETPAFDFVCANLTIDVITPILPLLIKKTKRILILSGILKEQENLIAESLRKLAISDFQVEMDGEWISVKIEKEI